MRRADFATLINVGWFACEVTNARYGALAPSRAGTRDRGGAARIVMTCPLPQCNPVVVRDPIFTLNLSLRSQLSAQPERDTMASINFRIGTKLGLTAGLGVVLVGGMLANQLQGNQSI